MYYILVQFYVLNMYVTVYFIINQYLQIDKSERGYILIVYKNYTLKKNM